MKDEMIRLNVHNEAESGEDWDQELERKPSRVEERLRSGSHTTANQSGEKIFMVNQSASSKLSIMFV